MIGSGLGRQICESRSSRSEQRLVAARRSQGDFDLKGRVNNLTGVCSRYQGITCEADPRQTTEMEGEMVDFPLA